MTIALSALSRTDLKVISVVGARPQFIKAALVSQALKASGHVQEFMVHTGQHYDDNMSRVFFRELEIPEPKFNLGIGSAPHGAQTGRMLEAIEQVLLETRPDWVVLFGDTNSTLAGALAATKLHISVAHVEAGLRSNNRRMPEEINRVLVDHASDLLFAPTDIAVANLRGEGIAESKLHLVGDVMFDAALYYASSAERQSRILDRLGLSRKEYVLATIHRAENTDDLNRLKAIFEGLRKVADTIPVVIPLHPRTRAILNRIGTEEKVLRGLIQIDPVGYLDMMLLEKYAALIATDSGGVQKEAFFHRVPCVTLRSETEWVELVDLGWNHVLGDEKLDNLEKTIIGALGRSGAAGTPYGNGHASEIIATLLLS